MEGQLDERSHRWEETTVCSNSPGRGWWQLGWSGSDGGGEKGWIPQGFRVQQNELGDGLGVEGGVQRHQGTPPYTQTQVPVCGLMG